TAGEHALEAITDTMGGAMFYPDQITELDGIFDRINRELRTQYRLGYYPNPRGPANTYRSVVVTVSPAASQADSSAADSSANTTPTASASTSVTYEVRHRKTYFTGTQ